MEKGIRQPEKTPQPELIYISPESKTDVDFSQAPQPGDDITQEMGWHMDNKAYQNVTKQDGSGWSKDDTLNAISDGFADAFTVNRFRFPPIPQGTWMTEHLPIQFDDKDFGERIANRTLLGFKREPRS